MTTSDAAPRDPAEAIAAALAQLRGRRGPRPPWAADDGAGRAPWGPGGRGGPHTGHHGHRGGRGTDPREGDHRGSDERGGWPEAMQARFGGPARLRLLEALVAASGSLSVSEIGEAIGVDQPRASRLVAQSVDLGLVRREADPGDARRTRVALTGQGAAIVRGFRGDRREAVDRALADFSDQERADLARLLVKLAAAWPRA